MTYELEGVIMDNFSKVLKDHISRMDIKIQNLATASGVDRSLIQKMIKGDRVPADKDMIERIILALMLTPRQAVELRNYYHIARIGEEVYLRHLLVKDVLECFGTVSNQTDSIFITTYSHTFMQSPNQSVFNGIQEINHLVKTITEIEATKEDASLKIVIQPEYSFLIDHLSIIGSSHNNLIIEHIFCLQESIKEKDENRYNLGCIRNIAPLLTSGCNYNPNIYYDNVSSHINHTSIFPYFILTSEHVVAVSYDYTYAVLYQDASFLKLYTTIYSNLKFYTIPLIEKLPSPLETFNHYVKFESIQSKYNKDRTLSFTMFSQPCLMFFINQTMLDKYTLDFPGRETLITMTNKRSMSYLSKIKSGYEYTSYFTLDGIKDFWETGRIREIPDNFYHPLEKEDRFQLLSMLYEAGSKYSYNCLLINKDTLRLTDYLVVTALDDSAISMIYSHPGKEPICFTFKEKSLTYAFHCFFDYLKGSDLIVSKNDTLAVLKKQLDIYAKELKEDQLKEI